MKKLKDPNAWKVEDGPKIINDPASWVNTDINEQEITNILISTDAASGKTQMQLLLSVDGKQKFSDLAKSNIDKPIGIFVNDYQYPFAVPVISQGLADSPGADPVITGSMPVDVLKELILQMKTGPLPVPVSFIRTAPVGSSLGNGFIRSYGIALAVSLLLLFLFFIIKFRLLGLVYDWALLISLVVFSACAKLVSLIVNLPSLVGALFFLFVLSELGYLLLKKLNEENTDDRPYELALFQSYEKYKGVIVSMGVLMTIAAFVVTSFSFGKTKSFGVSMTIGIVLLLLHYFFISRILLDIFGRKTK